MRAMLIFLALIAASTARSETLQCSAAFGMDSVELVNLVEEPHSALRSLFDVLESFGRSKEAARASIQSLISTPEGESFVRNGIATNPKMNSAVTRFERFTSFRTLRNYMRGNFEENRNLRNGSKAVQECKSCRTLLASLKKLEAYDGIVYRVVSRTRIEEQPEEFKEFWKRLLTVGTVFTDQGFMSSSRSTDGIGQFFDDYSMMFIIRSKTGRSVEKVFSGLGRFIEGEQEVLFPAGTSFRVDAVLPLPNSSVPLIFMTEIGSDID